MEASDIVLGAERGTAGWEVKKPNLMLTLVSDVPSKSKILSPETTPLPGNLW